MQQLGNKHDEKHDHDEDHKRSREHEHNEGAEHDYSQHYRSSRKRDLWLTAVLLGSFAFLEIIGGLFANSLALLADAAHMVTDLFAIGLSLFAFWISSRPPSQGLSFGSQRAEVLAALANVLGLWLITAWVSFEAVQRLMDPPAVQGPLVLGVGAAGLLANIGALFVLRRSAKESMNIEAAFLHVLGDTLGSIGVMVGAVLILAKGWYIADPILALFISVLILASTTRLLRNTLSMLMEGTPRDVQLPRIVSRFKAVKGVTEVHDVHVWALTSGYNVLSAHVTSDAQSLMERDDLLQHLRSASREFKIEHITIQLEQTEDGCTELHHLAIGGARKR